MIGIHVSKTSKVLEKKKTREMHDAINQESSLFGLDICQIFTHGPRNIYRVKMDYKAVKECKIPTIVHSSYMTVALWKLVEGNEAANSRRLEHLNDQLEVCDIIGSKFLVVHIGNKDHSILAKCVKLMKPVLKNHKCRICFEVEPLKPSDKSHETPKKLASLCRRIKKVLSRKYWALCIDTAHLWGGGIDVRNDSAKWLGDLPEWVRKMIQILHLNGSYADLASHKDKHAIPFSKEDKIWHKNEDKIHPWWALAAENNIPVIYEINRGKEKDVEYLLRKHKEYNQNFAR